MSAVMSVFLPRAVAASISSVRNAIRPSAENSAAVDLVLAGTGGHRLAQGPNQRSGVADRARDVCGRQRDGIGTDSGRWPALAGRARSVPDHRRVAHPAAEHWIEFAATNHALT